MSILELEDDKNVNINLHHLKYISKKNHSGSNWLQVSVCQNKKFHGPYESENV